MIVVFNAYCHCLFCTGEKGSPDEAVKLVKFKDMEDDVKKDEEVKKEEESKMDVGPGGDANGVKA